MEHQEPSEQFVDFLMDAIRIAGVPRYVYADVLRECNGDLSAALDKMTEIRKDVVYNHKTFADAHKPAAPKVDEQPKPAEPKPAEQPKPVEPKPVEPNPAEQPKPVEPKPVEPKPVAPLAQASAAKLRRNADAVADADREFEMLMNANRMQNEAIDAIRKEDEEKARALEERKQQLEKAMKEKKEQKQKIEEQLRDPNLSGKAKENLMAEAHENMVAISRIGTMINPEARPPPEYMIGRLPTEECEIHVTVKDMTITFTWDIPDTAEVHPKDWIGLYIHDRQYSNKHETYTYLEERHHGSSSFVAPTIGFYDLRYYPNGGSIEHSRSEPFVVGPQMPVHAKRDGRRKIAVSWDRDAELPGDWLALYPVETYSNTKYLQTINAANANNDGVVFFDAPRRPGEYEVRYFFTNKRHASGYAYSGRSEPIVIPNEDGMEVIATHPIVKVRWQTYSQEPRSRDWVGLFSSKDDSAKNMGWCYLSTKGLMDCVGDHGVAEIEVKQLMNLSPEAELPEEAVNWEVRLYNGTSSSVPFLRAPYLKPK